MTFQRSCLYHPTDGMIVIEANQQAEYKRLIDTGVWFDHPNKAKEMRNYHEEQIRRRPRQRRSNAKHETKTI
jgi:hypothetical protein